MMKKILFKSFTINLPYSIVRLKQKITAKVDISTTRSGMERYIVLAWIAFVAIVANAQSEQKSVLKSDISGKYRQAVHDSFYHTLSNYSGLEPGYHGFADLGYTFGMGDYDFGRFEINTSHGYQFNPYFFLGAGVGIHFMSEYDTPDMHIALDYRKSQVDIPIFANARWTILNRRVTPFIDGKLGYYVTHGGGLYANISIGCRVYTFGNQAVSITVGYTNEELEFQTFGSFVSSSSMNYTRSFRKLSTEGVALKVGYEF